MAGAALIVAVVLLVYLPSINGEFILDDDKLLTENGLVRAPEGIELFWRTTEAMDFWPAANSMFWMEWRLWGMHPAGYHVTNLILHAAEAFLIWAILRKLAIPGAFLAATLFAVHPVNVESVAWIAQRKDMLALLFFLLSILWYMKGIQWAADTHPDGTQMAPGREIANVFIQYSSLILHPSSFIPYPLSFYWLSLGAFVMAMLSKGSAVILPVVLVGIAWWLRPAGAGSFSTTTKMRLRRFIGRELLSLSPFFLVAVLLAAINIWFQTHGVEVVIRNVTFTQRLLGAGCVPWFYLYKAIVPVDLAFVYPQWRIEAGNPLWWPPLLAALAVTAVLCLNKKEWSRVMLFAWGFFCVSLVPVMGFTDVGFMRHSLVADHYQHIAVIGVVALVAACLVLWHERARGRLRRVMPVIAVAAAGAFAILTWRQSSLYADALTLYKFALEKNPDSWMIQNDMGKKLYERGRMDEAMEYYRQAVRLNPDLFKVHYNIGIVLAETGRPQEAIGEYEQALRLQQNYPELFNNMGIALFQAGRPAESIEYFEKALCLKPDYILAQNGLGAALIQTGRPLEAIKHFKQALLINPDYLDAWNNLIFAYNDAGQYDEAVSAAQKALELARSQGQKALAGEIEKWLELHRSGPLPQR